ncbi:unnamed protein product [Ambrosiozyma monospora]|uniref:Unnamed protein product n=1 Tax=Ambrosiozyma monospora TaxID=43982 RepID=A0ACB5U7X6_AMBMO|nr:unnamed protein product [Ambrosiozyma monospora]
MNYIKTHQHQTPLLKFKVGPPSLIPANLNTGSSVKLNGLWVEGKGKQKYEVKITDTAEEIESGKKKDSLVVLGEVQELYPLQKKTHTAQFLRSIPQYRWRMQHLAALLRFRSYVEASLVEFYNLHSFTKTHPPLVTSSDCEGAGELFKIESNSLIGTKEKFFGKDAFLTVSTQLHLEVMCAALSRVWTLTPCFRAEESDTNRHFFLK